MCSSRTYSVYKSQRRTYKYDPTRSITLRNWFAAGTNRFFNQFAKDMRNVFSSSAFLNLSNVDKLTYFNNWFDSYVYRNLSFEQFYKYIEEAYKKGVRRAGFEASRARYKVPPIKELFDIFQLSQHTSVLDVLKGLLQSELQGIVDNLRTQMVRLLSEGLIAGENSDVLLQKVLSVITGKNVKELGVTKTLGRFVSAKRRAEIMARTEVVRAHHLAMVAEYRRWSVEGVYIIAEWGTVGDDKVCEQCANNEGMLFTLDEIEKMIPAHPLCRCIAIPIRAKRNFKTLQMNVLITNRSNSKGKWRSHYYELR